MLSRLENSHYVPLFCNLKGKKVVVIGGGRVAERKVRSLLPSGAQITVISPKVTTGLSEMIEKEGVEHLKRPFQYGDLEGAWLVISATDDEKVQETVFSEAEERRCLCNVVDKPDKCSFIVPSIVKRGALTVAISTGGQSPALARALRLKLEEEFGQEWALYLELIGRLRRHILTERDGRGADSRLNRLVCFECLDWIREKEWEKLLKWAIDLGGEKAEKLARETISLWTDSFSN